MKKTSTLVAVLSAVFFVAFFFVPKLVFADGFIIESDPYSNRWDYSNENSQQAFINFDGGLQKMIISIGFEGDDSDGLVWLFPVPAEPNRVAIDVVENLPQLSGGEISRLAQSNLDEVANYLMTTQIYPIPLIENSSMLGSADTYGAAESGGTWNGLAPEVDVLVYDHLEKEGITSEIITAKTANGLYEYLKNKGLKIESGSIPVLNNYIGKEYSFVASWIGSLKNKLSTQESRGFGEAKAGDQKGVFVTFPTKDLYFPLLPTSVYGSKVVPATIRIIGHVSPKVFQDIKSFTNTKYYIDSYASFPEDINTFHKGSGDSIKYTKIEINAPSKFLTEDLWLGKQAPVKIYYSAFFAEHPVIIGIILLILSSIAASIIAGMLVFRDLRNNPVKLVIVGLSNLLTIIGVSTAIFLINTKNQNDAVTPLLAEIKQRGCFWKRRVTAVCLFLLCITCLMFEMYYIEETYDYFSYGYGSLGEFMGNIVIIFILPSSVLISGFVLRRIKAEDVYLFEQLKLYGYSSWTFQPKDKMKFVFIPVFSVSFLVISWLLIRFFNFTV